MVAKPKLRKKLNKTINIIPGEEVAVPDFFIKPDGSTFTATDQQVDIAKAAATAISYSLEGEDMPIQCLAVQALAGTGKTSLLAYLMNILPGSKMCCTFTRGATAEMSARIKRNDTEIKSCHSKGLKLLYSTGKDFKLGKDVDGPKRFYLGRRAESMLDKSDGFASAILKSGAHGGYKFVRLMTGAMDQYSFDMDDPLSCIPGIEVSDAINGLQMTLTASNKRQWKAYAKVATSKLGAELTRLKLRTDDNFALYEKFISAVKLVMVEERFRFDFSVMFERFEEVMEMEQIDLIEHPMRNPKVQELFEKGWMNPSKVAKSITKTLSRIVHKLIILDIQMAMGAHSTNRVPDNALTFTDMIFLPVYFDLTPNFFHDIIVVDEAQDLNPLQHAFVKLLATKPDGTTSQVIIVGDENQSIFGFSGASTDSFRRMVRQFLAEEHPLTLCFRCPDEIIAMAQKYVPSIEGTGKKGEIIIHPDRHYPGVYKRNQLVLGRSRLDVVSGYFDALSQTESVETMVKGISISGTIKQAVNRMRDITDGEIGNLLEFVVNNLFALAEIEHELYSDEDEENPRKGPTEKLIETYYPSGENPYEGEGMLETDVSADDLREDGETYGITFRALQHLGYYKPTDSTYLPERMSDSGFFQLMERHFKDAYGGGVAKTDTDIDYDRYCVFSTIHQAKGTESPHVIILGADKLAGPWMKDDSRQEFNLAYVAITRVSTQLDPETGEQLGILEICGGDFTDASNVDKVVF